MAKLNPGDVVWWEPGPEEEHLQGAPLVVDEQLTGLFFVYNPKPWHEQLFEGHAGLTITEVEEVLSGNMRFNLPGRIYKSYDAATGRSYADPMLGALPPLMNGE